jgi:hypothetical protein
MKKAALMAMALVLAALALGQGSVQADLIDPADIHINGPNGVGGLPTAGGGTDWVTLPNFNGQFSVQDISNTTNPDPITPWHLILAVPNFSGTLLDNITLIGTTSVTVSPHFVTTLTSGNAYEALGLPKGTAPASVSFGNFQSADTTVLGGTAPTSYGLYDFTVSAASLALLNKVIDNVDISSTQVPPVSLPPGTIIFAYGLGGDGKTYSTPFTEAGVITPLADVVPEPSTLAIAGLGGLGLLVYGLRRRSS